MEGADVIAVNLDVSIIELLLLIILAFIGAFCHEYLTFINRGKRITLSIWVNITITVAIDVVFCLVINPFIIGFGSRMILLPPLILGLLGTELMSKLSTVNGSFSFIEYILGFFGIKRGDNTETPTDPVHENDRRERTPAPFPTEESSVAPPRIAPPEVVEDPSNKVIYEIMHIENSILKEITDYERTHDRVEFLKARDDIIYKLSVIKETIKNNQDLSVDALNEYNKLLQTERRLNTLSNRVIASYNEEETNTE